MTVGALRDTRDLTRYARAQIEAADAALAAHSEAGLDLCLCGRLHTCDERRKWLRTLDHYGRFVGAAS